jgi:hypothetical protein
MQFVRSEGFLFPKKNGNQHYSQLPKTKQNTTMKSFQPHQISVSQIRTIGMPANSWTHPSKAQNYQKMAPI